MSDDGPRWRRLDRRTLLRLGLTATAAGGVGIGLGFWGGGRYERRRMRVPERPEPFSPSVFLAIDEDGVTTVWVTRSEMGQGVSTALPMIVAHALDAEWRDVRIVQAPASEIYGNQGTMASASVASMWDELREAGAIARQMLLTAAARTWRVDVNVCGTRPGFVVHSASGRSLSYGALSALAGALPVPPAPPLRDRAELPRIGPPTRRLDSRDKAEGRAKYGIDVRLPGMWFASIERPRGLEGSVGEADEAAARAIAAVQDILRMRSGAVAVFAEHTFGAIAGRRALSAAQTSAGPTSSARVMQALREAVRGEGVVAHSAGEQGLSPHRTHHAQFEVPYLAHQCMEPINATARIEAGRCDVWAPTQDPQRVRSLVQELTGLPRGDCQIHVMLLGGGFGRRTVPAEIREVVELAQHVSPRAVQLVWTREDDVQHDFYRAGAVHRLSVSVDERGDIVRWRDHVATPTSSGQIAAGGEVDRLAVDGTRIPYRVPAIEVRWSDVAAGIPAGIWRSVGHSYNAFAVEAMIDEVARSTERDPLAFRLGLLGADARQRAVLERVREMSGWGQPPPTDRARGVAVHGCFGSVCAQVAEVSELNGRVRVHRVWAAVECGLVVNPLGVKAQIMGGIVFGLSAALYGQITVDRGEVEQSNFHDARLLRMRDCPEIEVQIVPREGSHVGGIGEVGVPPIAPAVANALAVLRGAPVRRLPLVGS